MKIGIIGSGYVGLTTGICLASLKHQIFIYDVDEKKLGEILEGKLPFFERGLGEILEKVSSTEEFRPQNNLDDLIRETDGCFVCVGTPTKNNSIDLSQIINSINSITESIKKNNKRNYKIIIRSTIIPNTSKDVILPILERELSELEFGLAVVPEFLREGNALDDFMNPDKIVIGSLDEDTTNFVKNVFNHFEEKCEIIETNLESSELIKEVVITAGSFGASDDDKVIVLDPIDVVTVASSRGEISGALEALPGTQPQADKEGIYVRGGDASEAKQIVDGMLIQNPYFSDVPDITQRGRFEPFDFQGTAFSQGGYSAQYGQALSAIVFKDGQHC